MNKIRLRTKAEIFGALLVIVLLVALSAESVTRTITDSTDNSYTLIRNSNGKYWDATGANLQAAINDLGTTGGTVWCGDDITLASTLTLKSYTTLDFENHLVTLGANVTFLNMTGGNNGNIIRNVRISIPDHFVRDIITLYIDSTAWVHSIEYNVFENIWMDNQIYERNHNYTGIHLYAQKGTVLEAIARNTFNKIVIEYPKYGILLENADNSSFINTNNFNDIWIEGCVNGVEFRNSRNSIGGMGSNIFDNVKMQSTSYTEYGYIIGSDNNHFLNAYVYDWYGATAGIKEVYILPGTSRAKIELNYLGDWNNILDLGSQSYIYSDDLGHFYDRGPYTYNIFRNATHVFLQDGSSGKILYIDTNARQIFYYAQNYANNAVIFIREGTYDIGSVLESSPQHDITWLGADKHKTILRASATLSNGMFYLNNRKNVTFRDLKFEGVGNNAYGIFLMLDTSTWGVLIDNCIFKNFSGGSGWSTVIYSAAPSTDTLSNIKITNCEFESNTYAINLNGDTDPSRIVWCEISNNYFTECTNNIRLNFARNSTINNNRINGGTTGIILKDCMDCIVNGNVITSTNGIAEQGGSNFNIITCNNCRTCTTPIDINGAGTIHANTNLGTIS
jgi:parallel beta-helix repeat protein